MKRIEKIQEISRHEKLNKQAKRLIDGHGGTMDDQQVASLERYIQENEQRIERLHNVKTENEI